MNIKYTIAFVELTGVVCFGIGVAGIIGHLYSLPRLYDWIGNNVGMAFASSTLAMFTGLSLILIAEILKHGQQNH